jgi:hypothetical protein
MRTVQHWLRPIILLRALYHNGSGVAMEVWWKTAVSWHWDGETKQMFALFVSAAIEPTHAPRYDLNRCYDDLFSRFGSAAIHRSGAATQ